MKTNQLLAGVMVLQGLILASVWSGGRASYESIAQAQVPDPGAQRIRMIEELKALNEKVERMATIMESGKLQVRVVTPDEKNGPAK